ncbi:hypothetical protein ES703_80369 [subsurface metagenome]
MKQVRLYLEKLFCPYCFDVTWHLFRFDGIFECLVCRTKPR